MIKGPQLSDAVSRACADHVHRFLRPGDPSLAEVDPNQVHVHRAFTLRIDPVPNDLRELEHSTAPVRWRFLMGTRSGQALYASVAHEPPGEPKMTGLSRGVEVTKAFQALRYVRKLPELKGDPERNYELRVLAIPALLTDAFWLKSDSGSLADDRIVPFFTGLKDLSPMRAVSVEKFLDTIRPLAEKRANAWTRAV